MIQAHGGSFAAFALAGSGAAMADDDCNVPMNQWQSREAVQKSAEAHGWKVSRIKIDDGCYQIRASTRRDSHSRQRSIRGPLRSSR